MFDADIFDSFLRFVTLCRRFDADAIMLRRFLL